MFYTPTKNSADPDQTAPMEQSDLVLNCLLKCLSVCILRVKTTTHKRRVPGLVDRVLPFRQEVEGLTPTCGTCPNNFF